MDEKVLKNYAKLIVRKGVNVQKDQEVIISANVKDEYFVKYVVEEAYSAGAKRVRVDWSSDVLSRLQYQYEDKEVLSEVLSYEEAKWQRETEVLPAKIRITSDDPDSLSGIDSDKLSYVSGNRSKVRLEYLEKMDNKYQWTIIGIPGKAWAKKVFPNLSDEEAIEKLWEAIIKVTRITDDPIKAWDIHNKYLDDKKNILNKLKIKKLWYKASNGTDFYIELHKNVKFEAAEELTLGGVPYNPNMPTEECFTSPKWRTAEGVVYASKPLSVFGNVVTDFGFRFQRGRVVEVIAKDTKTKEVLEKLISIDKGAAQLGEIAFVPFDSPINQTGLMFYETLFDENACCHLALGRAFTECIENYQNLSEEEINAVNLNKSSIHVDFMIGTSDLSIVGETFDGETVEIFKNGVYAI